MSDPMSSSQIEDVLSSIRRLVAAEASEADGEQPAAGQPPAATTKDAEEEAAHALVLTSSQRVDEQPTVASESAPAQIAAEAWDEDAANDTLQAPYDHIEDATDATSQEWEPEEGEGDAMSLPTFIRARSQPAPPPVMPDSEGHQQHLDPAPEAAPLERPEPDERPRGGGFLFPSRVEPTQEQGSADAGAGYTSDETGGSIDPTSTAAEETTASIEEGADLSRDAEASSEMAASIGSAPYEPDEDVDVSEDSSDATSDENIFEDDSSEALDDAALRALISQVVHEELTGALGERITRNVRKLVRREIHRALASRDFD